MDLPQYWQQYILLLRVPAAAFKKIWLQDLEFGVKGDEIVLDSFFSESPKIAKTQSIIVFNYLFFVSLRNTRYARAS